MAVFRRSLFASYSPATKSPAAFYPIERLKNPAPFADAYVLHSQKIEFTLRSGFHGNDSAVASTSLSDARNGRMSISDLHFQESIRFWFVGSNHTFSLVRRDANRWLRIPLSRKSCAQSEPAISILPAQAISEYRAIPLIRKNAFALRLLFTRKTQFGRL